MKKLIICAICAICGITTANAQKFGHVNSQEVIQAMPEFTKARTDIEALTKQYEADLKSMQEELQKKSEAYEKEQATLPANIKERRETELQEMYQKPLRRKSQHCPRISRPVASRSFRICTRRFSRAIRTTSRHWPRSSQRRCRLSPTKYLMLSRPLDRLVVTYISWTSAVVSPTSAPLCQPMSLHR